MKILLIVSYLILNLSSAEAQQHAPIPPHSCKDMEIFMSKHRQNGEFFCINNQRAITIECGSSEQKSCAMICDVNNYYSENEKAVLPAILWMNYNQSNDEYHRYHVASQLIKKADQFEYNSHGFSYYGKEVSEGMAGFSSFSTEIEFKDGSNILHAFGYKTKDYRLMPWDTQKKHELTVWRKGCRVIKNLN